jgi:peptidoglycan/LPS O-acetylase OafA/YrhL
LKTITEWVKSECSNIISVSPLQIGFFLKIAFTSHQSHLLHPKYRRDIDGLRALAVLSVVFYHAFPDILHGGFVGVDIFFVISGFLISTIIFENLENNTFSFFEFYSRRIRRIFPALILVLTLCLIFGWFALLSDEYEQLGKHIASSVAFIQNFILWNESGYFDNSAETKPLLHLWSLGIEEQFYIVFPFLLWATWKTKLSPPVLIIIVGGISLVLNLMCIQKDIVATFYSPQTRFWELLAGSLLGWLTLHPSETISVILAKTSSWIKSVIPMKDINKFDVISTLFSIIGISLIVWSITQIDGNWAFPGVWAILPVMGAVLIIGAGQAAWVNRFVLSNRVAVWIGLISYPLYLWHWPLLSFARIIEGKIPHRGTRLVIIGASIIFAALTYLLIERPIRFGNRSNFFKVAALVGFAIVLALTGLMFDETSFIKLYKSNELLVKRKGLEFKIGPSSSYFRGKNDWLFLGNNSQNTIAKLKLSIIPSETEIQDIINPFKNLAEQAAQFNTKVILIIDPNKSSIYPEFLPDELIPSKKKYVDFFLDKLKDVPNLIVYNPTNDLLRLKNREGILYWMTDTHWNAKGAFLTYEGFCRIFDLPVPKIEFQQGSTFRGGLIDIAKLNDFPLHSDDNWDVIWKDKPVWTEKEIPNAVKYVAFGAPTIVTNNSALSDKRIWVVGDSFTSGLRQYFNATFKETRYVGHWGEKLKDLPLDLVKADEKPDMIIIVRVERSF